MLIHRHRLENAVGGLWYSAIAMFGTLKCQDFRRRALSAVVSAGASIGPIDDKTLFFKKLVAPKVTNMVGAIYCSIRRIEISL